MPEHIQTVYGLRQNGFDLDGVAILLPNQGEGKVYLLPVDARSQCLFGSIAIESLESIRYRDRRRKGLRGALADVYIDRAHSWSLRFYFECLTLCHRDTPFTRSQGPRWSCEEASTLS